ncbi:MAG: type III pantothenate kinase [Chlorobium sp.]|nr:MAG: type III pantothenate kinase [Chlorobium sp.]
MLFSTEPSLSDTLLLVVETGNTTASFAVFNAEDCLEVHKVPSASLFSHEAVEGVVVPLLQKYPLLRNAALCSVVPSLEPLILTTLRRYLSGQLLEVTFSMRMPFTLHYESPESFGADRIALCALSRMLYPDGAVIALDIGTAITVDVLGSRKDYLGGLIMPGLELMANALHDRTARLPLVALELPETLIGRSTSDCIRNGIIRGCAASIEGLLGKIKRWLVDEQGEERIVVIATGGSAPLVSAMLEVSPVLEELAVLKGTRYLFSLNSSR